MDITWSDFIDEVNQLVCPYFKYVATSRYIMMAEGWTLGRGPETDVEIAMYKKLQADNLEYAHLSSVEGESMLARFDRLYEKYCNVFKYVIRPKLAFMAHAEKRLYYETRNLEIGFTESIEERKNETF